MSYILDALKKLDKKTERGRAPNLFTVHEPAYPLQSEASRTGRPVPEELKKFRVWHYLLITALLVNAVILVVWISPWHSVAPTRQVNQGGQVYPPLAAPEATRAGQAGSMPSRIVTAKITERAIQKSTRESSSGQDAKPAYPLRSEASRTGRQASGPNITEPLLIKKPSEASLPEQTSPQIQKQTSVSESAYLLRSEASRTGRSTTKPVVINIDDLPQSVRQELPNLTITGHIYSNKPSSRVVTINSQIIREGESVTPQSKSTRSEMKLEEITPDGIILSFKDYLFRINR